MIISVSAFTMPPWSMLPHIDAGEWGSIRLNCFDIRMALENATFTPGGEGLSCGKRVSEAVKLYSSISACNGRCFGGGISTVGFIARLLGKKGKSEIDQMPPIYGGDGLSERSPAIVNCASMRMAQALIDRFISEKWGQQWNRGVELTVADPNDASRSLRVICVVTEEGEEHRYYFDLSRPLGVAMKMGLL